MKNHTAKHFALQLGSLASLYLSLSFLLVLIFSLINIIFPDAADSVWQTESASSGIRIGIAMVVVFFPTYLVLTRIVNKTRRKDPNSNYLGLTKWLIYLSLLVGGAVLLGDLVAIIMAFLEGEITQRFILKAAALLIVVGGAFWYYLMDAKGHWMTNEVGSVTYGLITSVLVLVFVVIGFMNIEPPTEVREQKLDDAQISDLQNIQWKVQDYLAVNETIPDSLEELKGNVPEAPEGRSAYTFEKTETGFNLCATFRTESKAQDYYGRPYISDSERAYIANPDDWEHGVGETCFERVVKTNEPE